MFYLPVNVLAQYMKATMLFCFEINVKMSLTFHLVCSESTDDWFSYYPKVILTINCQFSNY